MTQTDVVDPPRTLQMAGGVIRHIESLIARTSPVGDRCFFEPALFPWTTQVEAAYPDIARELAALLADLDEVPGFEVISTDQEKLTNDGRWKTFFFRGYGVDFPDNCRACPRTWEAVLKIPRMTTAFFSILEPGKQIPPHRGPYKGVLRYHLGLVLPRRPEGAWLDVGGERRHWEAGKSLVFDDSYVHSAGNDTEDVRVVLFVDFVRPLPFPVSLLNELVIGLISRSPYVREAKQNYDDWRAKRLKLRAGPTA